VSLDDWTRLAFTLVVFYLWVDNLLHAYQNWSQYRDARSFRAFLIGYLVAFGSLAFVLGAVTQLWPDFRPVSVFFGFMVTGALLVVGIFVRRSWRR
jgi:hypothetical protein